MGEVINITSSDEWRDAGLARKSLAWHRAERMKGNPLFDFSEAIAKEESLLRSFVTRAA